jgi:small nuclear ribonucleoprotein (snRNP)-like protein
LSSLLCFCCYKPSTLLLHLSAGSGRCLHIYWPLPNISTSFPTWFVGYEYLLNKFCVYSAPTDVWLQIFLTFFKTLEGKTLIVELKNDLRIQGVLSSVDQYHNLKLTDVTVLDKERFPQLVSHPSFSPLDS